MKEVARLESQLEENDMKPKSKMSQRPKDTYVKDQVHSLSNNSVQKVKSIDAKQLVEVVHLLKLHLQQKNIAANNRQGVTQLILQTDDYNMQTPITIGELRQKFEKLSIDMKKSTQLARFLIEPPGQTDIIFNENQKLQLLRVMMNLQKLIGQY